MRKSLCTHSQPTRFTLFLYNKRSRARDPPLERVPHGCKAENPRYKCQVRLSAFHPLPALPAFFAPLVFRHRGRNCLFAIPRRDCISPFCTFPSLLSSLPYFPVFSDLLLSLNHPLLSFFVLLLPRNFNSSRSLSNKPISISIVLKSPVRAFSPSCCCPSPLDFPSLLPPGPAHFAPVRNNKRSTRGVTTPRLGRNRADLRPGSEKAIWANRTPPAEGGEGPADNEQPYGR